MQKFLIAAAVMLIVSDGSSLPVAYAAEPADSGTVQMIGIAQGCDSAHATRALRRLPPEQTRTDLAIGSAARNGDADSIRQGFALLPLFVDWIKLQPPAAQLCDLHILLDWREMLIAASDRSGKNADIDANTRAQNDAWKRIKADESK